MLKNRNMRVDEDEKHLIELLRFIKKTAGSENVVASTLNLFTDRHNPVYVDDLLFCCIKVLIEDLSEFNNMISHYK